MMNSSGVVNLKATPLFVLVLIVYISSMYIKAL